MVTIGDWYAKVGNKVEPNIVGGFGLGSLQESNS